MRATIVCGLGFGDEGKGETIAYLSRRVRPDLVVRFNGGAQAAHHVKHNGVRFRFSQFGSGSFEGVPTLLSSFTFVDPLLLIDEAERLKGAGLASPFSLLHVDAEAVTLTAFHAYVNRIEELSRAEDRHGSCGLGIGVAFQDERSGAPTMRFADLYDVSLLRRRLQQIREHQIERARSVMGAAPLSKQIEELFTDLCEPAMPEFLVQRYTAVARLVLCVDGLVKIRESSTLLFEGAQGMLLDMEAGFFPHVTPSHTGPRNAERLLDAAGFTGERTTLGVTRTLPTRHGHGPFPTEDPALCFERDNNLEPGFQGSFRVGHADRLLLRYALDCMRPDGIVLTHTDYRPDRICVAYKEQSGALVESIADLPEPKADALSGCLPVYESVEIMPPRDVIALYEERMLDRNPVVLASDAPGRFIERSSMILR